MSVPLVNTVILQSIRLASAATARFSTAPDRVDYPSANHSPEALDAEVGLHNAPAELRDDAYISAAHAAVSVAGGSRVSSEVTSDRSRLADVAKDVVLRIECYDSKRWSYGTLAITWFAQLAAFIAASGITTEIVFQTRSQARTPDWFQQKSYAKVNCIAAAALLAAMLSMLGILTHRLAELRQQHKLWTQRRARLVGIHLVLLIIQVPNTVLYLAVNVWTLSGQCRLHGTLIDWFSFVAWSTMGSTASVLLTLAHSAWPSPSGISRSAIMLDRPWTVHWPVLLYWIPFEVVAGFESFLYPSSQRLPLLRSEPGSETQCLGLETCPYKRGYWALYLSVGGLMFVFSAAWIVLVVQVTAKLRTLPYHRFKLANMMIRFQTRVVVGCMLTFVINSFIAQVTNPESCISYLLIAFGRLPNQVILVALTLMMTFFHMPKLDEPIVTAWIQDFAWTEDQVPRRCAERAEHAKLPTREPMFCMETALKLLYWSFLVYREIAAVPEPMEPGAENLKPEGEATQERQGQEGAPAVEATLCRGLAMYGLKDAQMHSETASDTHVLVAWSADTILLAFRGTVTKANVLADLQAWPVVHPPARGNPWLGRRPRVHAGFLRSWRRNGLDDRVLEHIRSIVAEQQMDVGLVQFLITGHSLGGALAMLAAYDIQQAFGFRSLRVYTFGSPRVGNHPFAREYSDTVPNTWTIINDKDVVPTMPKFRINPLFVSFSLFKRSGLRVNLSVSEIINVRPSLMEARLGTVFSFGGSVRQHLLASYLEAFVRTCNAQMSSHTRMRGGLSGVKALLRQPPLRTMLLQAGLRQNFITKPGDTPV